MILWPLAGSPNRFDLLILPVCSSDSRNCGRGVGEPGALNLMAR
jgi:hypothetical protein